MIGQRRFLALGLGGISLFLSGCSVVRLTPNPNFFSPGTGTVSQTTPQGRVSTWSASDPSLPSQTVVGKKVDSIRAQLDELQADANGAVAILNGLHLKSQSVSSTYFGLIGSVNSKLQVGTTPGNPLLVNAWQEASAALDQFSAIGNEMSQLSNRVSSFGTQAGYLLDETRATFNLSGAVDEDHDALKRLEDELQKSEIQIFRTRQELSRQIERHNDYLATERRNLETLSLAIAKGEYYGQNLVNMRPFALEKDFIGLGSSVATPLGGKTGVLREPNAIQEKPLTFARKSSPFVVIRFNRQNVDYGQPLYQAMSEALKKNPHGSFEVMAVSSVDTATTQGVNAYKKAEEVVVAMAEMGVPRDRVKITKMNKANASAPEVQIFLR